MTGIEPNDDGGLSPSGRAAVAPRRVDHAAFRREFPSGDPSATECAQNLLRAAELFMDADSRGLRHHGLSIAARILLATLEGADGPLSQSAIADRLFVTGASVSSLVDTLERTGLVRRTRSTRTAASCSSTHRRGVPGGRRLPGRSDHAPRPRVRRARSAGAGDVRPPSGNVSARSMHSMSTLWSQRQGPGSYPHGAPTAVSPSPVPAVTRVHC